MSKYTTGEIAKLCNVSVRTVQFYDTKGILIPSEITDGGRRLYTDKNVKQLQLICLLKSLGLKLTEIKGILDSHFSTNTLLLILDEQSQKLTDELKEREIRLKDIKSVRTTLQNSETIPTEILTDIEHIMKESKKLRKVHYLLIITGVICAVIQYSTLLLGIMKGIWIPFILGMIAVISFIMWFTWYYRRNINYICPKCSTIFHPSFSEFAKGNHTFKTRELACHCCKTKSHCVETTNKVTEDHFH
ncbi:MerR family transcriptional regulator [Enterococcus italicus]